MGTPRRCAIRFHKKTKPIGFPDDTVSGADGFVLRDSRGHEHHFGSRELASPDLVLFTYVGTYSESGGYSYEYHVQSSLQEGGYELVEPRHGPHLTSTTRAATNHVVAQCARKGFAFPEEKQAAVQALLVLTGMREPFTPVDLEVYTATHGFDFEQAAAFRELAERVRDGRSFRPAIRLGPGQDERYREYWESHPDG